MLDLDDLKAFDKVAALGSFGQAARALGVTSSAVSKAVARLEAHLEVKLLIRTTRSVRLSEAGGAFLERALRALEELAEAEALLAARRGKARGVLRVEVPHALGLARVVPLLPDFCRRYPAIELELRSSDRIVELVTEGVDVALRVGELADASLIARRVSGSHVVTLASPAYLRKHGCPASPAALKRHVCLAFRSSNSGRLHAFRFAEGSDQPAFMPVRRHVFTSTQALLAAAAAGLGVAQCLDFSADSWLDRKELLPILTAQQAPGPPLSLLYRRESAELPRVRAFCDFVIERLASR